MYALTIHNPWAELFRTRRKWVENRTRPLTYRGPMALHASKKRLHASDVPQFPNAVFSAIVATAILVATIRIQALTKWAADGDRFSSLVLDHEYTEGPFCWVFRDVRPLDQPIICRGYQGLWMAPKSVIHVSGHGSSPLDKEWRSETLW